MTDEKVTVVTDEGQAEAKPPLAPPAESRFLFVDVAAQRAKQLRRGARPRLDGLNAPDATERVDLPHKPERIAMEEVRQGLISYQLPDSTPRGERSR